MANYGRRETSERVNVLKYLLMCPAGKSLSWHSLKNSQLSVLITKFMLFCGCCNNHEFISVLVDDLMDFGIGGLYEWHSVSSHNSAWVFVPHYIPGSVLLLIYTTLHYFSKYCIGKWSMVPHILLLCKNCMIMMYRIVYTKLSCTLLSQCGIN